MTFFFINSSVLKKNITISFVFVVLYNWNMDIASNIVMKELDIVYGTTLPNKFHSLMLRDLQR